MGVAIACGSTTIMLLVKLSVKSFLDTGKIIWFVPPFFHQPLVVSQSFQFPWLKYYISKINFIDEQLSTLFLDIWYVNGFLRARGTVRTAVMVREAPWLIVKLSKFNSLVSYCPNCPLNWLYCNESDAQR